MLPLTKQCKDAITNSNTKDLVCGYIKEHKLSLKLETIPQLIPYLVAAFSNGDYFASARDDCFKISEDKLTVTNIKKCSLSEQGIYLSHWVQSTSDKEIKWKFKINKLQDDMCFGLVSKENDTRESFWNLESKPCYTILNKGICRKFPKRPKYSTPILAPVEHWQDKDLQSVLCDGGVTFKSGDMVTFILSTKMRTFRCCVNDNHEVLLDFTVEEGEDIKWKMALALENPGDSVSIV